MNEKPGEIDRTKHSTNALFIAALLSLTASVAAAAEDIPIKIGVLNDRSGVYSDLAGEGSVSAAGWRRRISAPR